MNFLSWIRFVLKNFFLKVTIKKYLKNNGQKIFEKITVKKYLKNNGQKIFEKITVKKYLKK